METKLSFFGSAKPAVQEHCRRVGALANLIAHHLFLPTEAKQLLHAACLHHHGAGAEPPLPPDESHRLGAVMQAYAAPGKGAPVDRLLAAVMRLSEAFDCEFESQSSPRKHAAGILASLESGVAQGLWPKPVLEALRECTRPVAMPEPSEWRIPVFPQAAFRTLEALRAHESSLASVVDAARCDPATAGAIMQLANSALYSERGQVSNLQTAVARLGFENARKVVASLAMRPLLFLPRLEDLWPHSIEVADLAEQLAHRTDGIDPSEAYLAGLLHDVGRIALRATTLYDAARLQGLEDAGCPAIYAEDLILRTDHAVLGAQIAAIWNLPGRLITAIREHHRPETATERLAHILFLAEGISGSGEDLPSEGRLQQALHAAGLTQCALESCQRSDVGCWLAAA